jgi:hypothetical protein
MLNVCENINMNTEAQFIFSFWKNYVKILVKSHIVSWARICKRLRRPGIDSEDSIPPAYAMAGRYDK